MTRTNAVRLRSLRLSFARMLRGKRWISVKDIKMSEPDDLRGIPYTSLRVEYHPVISQLMFEIIQESKLSDYVDGGDDE